MKITLLFVSILGLSILVIGTTFFNLNNDDIKFEGVTISQEDYSSMNEINKDNMGYDVCNLNTNDCIRFINIDKTIALTK